MHTLYFECRCFAMCALHFTPYNLHSPCTSMFAAEYHIAHCALRLVLLTLRFARLILHFTMCALQCLHFALCFGMYNLYFTMQAFYIIIIMLTICTLQFKKHALGITMCALRFTMLLYYTHCKLNIALYALHIVHYKVQLVHCGSFM